MADENRERAMNTAIKEAYFRQHGALRGGKQYSIDEQYQLIFQRGAEYGAAEGIPQSDGWVDVADRLPDVQQQYLIRCADGVPEVCLFHLDFGWYGPNQDEVIAWMPIPTYQRPSSEGE